MIKGVKKSVCIIIAIILFVAVFTGCSKNTGIPGGDFEKQETISDAFRAEGNTTVTLTKDETVDMTGIDIVGRKEIFLNGFRLTLAGTYKYNEEGILDVKNNEGFDEAALDLSILGFDLTAAPSDNPMDISVIEIRSGIRVIEPVYTERIGLRDYGIMKEIHIKGNE